MWFRTLLVLSFLSLLGAAPQARPQYGPPVAPTPYDECDAAVAAVQTRSIPPTLLPAIARVESGRLDPATGRIRPWPWTINVEGVGSFFGTKEDAIAAVQGLQARGTRSIDVGCMQVNLFHHPTAFRDLDAAFDPPTNAAYAANFLVALHAQSKDWSLAAAYYHSQTQERGEEYQRRLFGRVVTPMGPPLLAGLGSGNPLVPSTAFGAFLSTTSLYGAFAPSTSLFGAFAPPIYVPPPGSSGPNRRSKNASRQRLTASFAEPAP